MTPEIIDGWQGIGLTGALIMALYGFHRGWWVLGSQYNKLEAKYETREAETKTLLTEKITAAQAEKADVTKMVLSYETRELALLKLLSESRTGATPPEGNPMRADGS